MNRYLKSLLITSFIYIFILLFFSETGKLLLQKKEPEKITLKLSDFQIVKPPKPKKTPIKKDGLYDLSSKEKTAKNDDNLTGENDMLSLSQISKFLIVSDGKFNQKNKEIKDLYGENYKELTQKQIAFLADNLSLIGLITQKYLEYPYLAARQKLDGTSVIEFFLYPNGDISEIKLIKSSGYDILDSNSIETVEVAYKDYPRPEEKTRIRITVHYTLY